MGRSIPSKSSSSGDDLLGGGRGGQQRRGALAHRAVRQHKSRPILNARRAWLEAYSALHLPKMPMGKAIGYATNQWESLARFDDERLSLDKLRVDAGTQHPAGNRSPSRDAFFSHFGPRTSSDNAVLSEDRGLIQERDGLLRSLV